MATPDLCEEHAAPIEALLAGVSEQPKGHGARQRGVSQRKIDGSTRRRGTPILSMEELERRRRAAAAK